LREQAERFIYYKPRTGKLEKKNKTKPKKPYFFIVPVTVLFHPAGQAG
jgi:hypothetical protein